MWCRGHQHRITAFLFRHLQTTSTFRSRTVYSPSLLSGEQATMKRRRAFHGRVVALLLPPAPVGGGDDGKNMKNATAAAHEHKPRTAQIDPSLLKKNTGPLHFRLEKPCGAAAFLLTGSAVSPLIDYAQSAQMSISSSSRSSNTSETADTTRNDSNASVTTLLDLYIYGNEDENDEDDDGSSSPFKGGSCGEQTLHFHLNRDSNETVGKTLRRMEMTLMKKLLSSSFLSSNRSNKQCKRERQQSQQQQSQQQQRDGREATAATPHAAAGAASQLIISASIWNVNAGTGQLQSKWDEACLSTLTNHQVWGNVALHHALAIQLEFLPALNNNDNDNNIDHPPYSPPPMHLLVECCPPTIVGVYTFCDFDSHLFVGVPLMINVDTLYADYTVVDWYCNGECVQRDSPCYIPRTSDVGKDLAVLLRPIRTGQGDLAAAHEGKGCEDAFRFKRCVEVRPENTIVNLRPTWTILRQECSSNQEKNDNHQKQQHLEPRIRVLTYNILADQNCFDSPGHVCRTYASYVSADIARKQRRLPLVLSEILSYQADVICLQEVDENVFDRLFKPILIGHYNYQGFFSCKASQGTREGCATFWSLNAFEPVPIQNQKRHILRDVYTNEQRIQDRDEEDDSWTSMADIQSVLACRPALRHVVTTVLAHVLQLVPLTLKNNNGASKSPPMIWVANTHLYFHPLASHIRLMQAYAICRQISRELKESKEQQEKLNQDDDNIAGGASIIICGDLNCSLTNAAGKLLIDRQVPCNFRDLKKHLQQFRYDRNDADGFDGDDFPEIRLPQHFPRFQSALHETPPITHFIPGFSATIDHILISSSNDKSSKSEEEGDGRKSSTKLISVRSAPMPSVRDVARDTAMPSPFLPSDHVSLLVELCVVSGDKVARKK